MDHWTNLIINGLPSLLFMILMAVLFIWPARKWQGIYQKRLENQNELLEQQLVLLRETIEILKQFRESRG